MASTITRDTWTNDTGTAANPNADGTVLNNTVLQNNIYARVDEMFAGAGSYARFDFGAAVQVATKLFINDTANGTLSIGLTINQGTADDEVIALKSSDVAHGITTISETDTYGYLKKSQGVSGGLIVAGVDDGGGSAHSALFLTGILGQAVETSKSTANYGVIRLGAFIKSGTGVTTAGTDGNLLSIDNAGTTRYIFDAEGSALADVEWITYDSHDDVALLDTLDTTFSTKDAVTNAFGEVLKYNRDTLQEAGIVHFYDDGPRAFVNLTRLGMLLTGAIRQLARQQAALDARVKALHA